MRSFLSSLKIVAVLAAFAVGYLAFEMTLLGRGVPPANVDSFDAYLAWQPDSTTFYATDDPPRLIAVGRFEGLLGSGPAAYVFDESGKLTQWELETGEGGQVTKLLNGKKQQLDRQETQDWFDQRAG